MRHPLLNVVGEITVNLLPVGLMRSLICNSMASQLLLLAILLAFPQTTQAAQGYSILEPDRITFEAFKYEHYRDAYFPYSTDGTPEVWAYGAGANIDFHLLDTGSFAIYSRNWLHLSATEKQVREAGWQWDQGLRFFNKVEMFYGHHSRHLLDEVPEPSTMKYPLQDTFGCRLIIYERAKHD